MFSCTSCQFSQTTHTHTHMHAHTHTHHMHTHTPHHTTTCIQKPHTKYHYDSFKCIDIIKRCPRHQHTRKHTHRHTSDKLIYSQCVVIQLCTARSKMQHANKMYTAYNLPQTFTKIQNVLCCHKLSYTQTYHTDHLGHVTAVEVPIMCLQTYHQY